MLKPTRRTGVPPLKRIVFPSVILKLALPEVADAGAVISEDAMRIPLSVVTSWLNKLLTNPATIDIANTARASLPLEAVSKRNARGDRNR